MIEQTPRGNPRGTVVSAPNRKFVDGVRRSLGYDLREEGGRVFLNLGPWFTEHGHPFAAPCVRLMLRKEDSRIVLEHLIIEEEGDRTSVDIGAARDALQAWMDYTCD